MRTAWPEVFAASVALRKESVDRNEAYSAMTQQTLSRSPQGERG